MARYIDVASRIAYIKRVYCDKCNHHDGIKCKSCGIDDALMLLEEAPEEDVAEVKHGKWYKHDKKIHGDTCYYCSVCEKMALSDSMVWELTDYCPNCGAKMDRERKEK